MDDNIVYFGPEDIEILDKSGYVENPSQLLNKLPEIAKPLIKDIGLGFSKIETLLYTAPSFINLVKSAFPETTLQAILTNEQKAQLAKGALKLMTKKDGSLLASLINPETNKIISSISLKSVKLTPEITKTMTSYTTQLQMAQIAEQIQSIQIAIEDVRKGREDDRLAIAYSCQQKLLQAREIKNKDLRTRMLLQVISDAEDSRNLLMLSQKSNVTFIKNQPKSTLGKLIKGDNPEKIESRINEIRNGLNAINMVSLSEAIAYYELDENEAARKSLSYFASFIDKTYLSTPDLLERLDLIDSLPENYWTKTLPNLERNIVALPFETKFTEIEENRHEEQ